MQKGKAKKEVKEIKTKKLSEEVAPKRSTQKEPVKSGKYHLEVEVNGEVFKTDAENLEEAFTKFVQSEKFHVAIKTQTVLKMGKGKSTRTKIWHVPEARRILRLMSFRPSALKILTDKLEQQIP